MARNENNSGAKIASKHIVQSQEWLAEADLVIASLWDQDVDSWDRYWVPVFALFARDLIADASPVPGDIVLDIGTGTGVAALEVSKAVPSVGLVVGIDRSPAMIGLAREKSARAGLRTARFHVMNAEDLRFPEEFFDVVISNCGIAIANFAGGMKEVLRVLRPGGVFAFNDWHLIDVKPHKIFGDVLGKYRTADPSPQLARERFALATTERFHHWLSPDTQQRIVGEAGFEDPKLVNRHYSVRLQSLEEYLKMRTTRQTIKREMQEMSTDMRESFLAELKGGLREFLGRDGFVFDWGVFYISAKKPR
jgi:ubiquinone/menaquinone biosynthesis C-methylase UbiE